MTEDFLIEKKLKEEAPDLHERLRDSTVVLRQMLEKFLAYFPTFTDHSIFHSLDVLDYSNRIIGPERIERLSPAECYVLISACYLHDIGMGIEEKEFLEFSKELDLEDYYKTHDRADVAATIRDFHNEYSGLFIKKYGEFLEIPEGDLLFGVIQTSRGHRKTDLFDEKEYPILETEYGTLRTPYLAAVIRLADEIDVGADRNPELLFDTSKLTRQRDIDAFGTHESIREVEVAADKIILHCKPKAPEFVPLIETLNEKVQDTLTYCVRAAEERTDFTISQKTTEIQWI